MKLKTPSNSKAATPIKGQDAVKKVSSNKKAKKASLSGAELGIKIEKILEGFKNGDNSKRTPSVKNTSPVKGRKDSSLSPVKVMKDLNDQKQGKASPAEKKRRKKKRKSVETSTEAMEEDSDDSMSSAPVLIEISPGDENEPLRITREVLRVKNNSPKKDALPQVASKSLKYPIVLQGVKALLASCNPADDENPLGGLVLIHMIVTSIKKPDAKRGTLRIQLKHCPYSDPDVCLIVRDKHKTDPELVVGEWETQLKSNGIECVSKVITVRQLSQEYKDFVLKGKLCNTYDVFLVDHTVAGHVNAILGKPFLARKKEPARVKLCTDQNLAIRVNAAIAQTRMHISSTQTNFTMLVGNDKQSDHLIAENIVMGSAALQGRFPGGWENVREISIQAVGGKPFPLYYSVANSNEVPVPKVIVAKPKAAVPVFGELTTVGKEVKVTPSGNVSILKAKRTAGEVGTDEEEEEEELQWDSSEDEDEMERFAKALEGIEGEEEDAGSEDEDIGAAKSEGTYLKTLHGDDDDSEDVDDSDSNADQDESEDVDSGEAKSESTYLKTLHGKGSHEDESEDEDEEEDGDESDSNEDQDETDESEDEDSGAAKSESTYLKALHGKDSSEEDSESEGDDDSDSNADQDESEDNIGQNSVKKRKGGDRNGSPQKRGKFASDFNSDSENKQHERASSRGGRGMRPRGGDRGAGGMSKRRSFDTSFNGGGSRGSFRGRGGRGDFRGRGDNRGRGGFRGRGDSRGRFSSQGGDSSRDRSDSRGRGRGNFQHRGGRGGRGFGGGFRGRGDSRGRGDGRGRFNSQGRDSSRDRDSSRGRFERRGRGDSHGRGRGSFQRGGRGGRGFRGGSSPDMNKSQRKSFIKQNNAF